MASTTDTDIRDDATVSFNGGPAIPFKEFEKRVNRMLGTTDVVTVRAREFALAWLNTSLASGDDKASPVLSRTLCLEFYRGGVLLIGCDGNVLFRSWVPAIVEDDGGRREPFPLVEEVADEAVVVMDTEQFGAAFMRSLVRVTNEEGREFDTLTLVKMDADEDAELALGDEFMRERLVVRAAGQRIDLKLFEQEYPKWRSAHRGIYEADRVDGLTISQRVFQLVGKIKGVDKIALDFYGEQKHVLFTATGFDNVEVRGLAMPMRREKNPEQ